MIFGTKRLRGIGTDLGGALKGFRSAMSEAEDESDDRKLKEPDAEFTEARTKEQTADQNNSS